MTCTALLLKLSVKRPGRAEIVTVNRISAEEFLERRWPIRRLHMQAVGPKNVNIVVSQKDAKVSNPYLCPTY